MVVVKTQNNIYHTKIILHIICSMIPPEMSPPPVKRLRKGQILNAHSPYTDSSSVAVSPPPTTLHSHHRHVCTPHPPRRSRSDSKTTSDHTTVAMLLAVQLMINRDGSFQFHKVPRFKILCDDDVRVPLFVWFPFSDSPVYPMTSSERKKPFAEQQTFFFFIIVFSLWSPSLPAVRRRREVFAEAACCTSFSHSVYYDNCLLYYSF